MNKHGIIITVILVVLVFIWWCISPKNKRKSSNNYRHLFADRPIITLPTGKVVEFCNLDNAASTPPFTFVVDKINEFIPYYSGVHRGSGFNSQLSTCIFDKSTEIIMDFVGANESHSCIYGKNTTECINKLAAYCKLEKSKKIIIGMQEHHSNLIPWMEFDPEFICVDDNGVLDLSDLEDKLVNEDVLLVSITGASNVSGVVNNVRKISEIVHRYGAYLSVDGAQLVPHRKVNIVYDGIDFLSFSAHKMYAPYGIGVLIGPKSFFAGKEPYMKGGGEVEMVTTSEVYWKDTPDKDNEGSPNVIGVIALAESIIMLKYLEMEKVVAYEEYLSEYAFKRFREIKEVNVVSYTDYQTENIGIISFQVSGMHQCLVSSILNYEFGIGCRAGCFCAAPYVSKLLGVSDMCVRRNIDSLENFGDKRNFNGMVRFSLSLGVTKEDIDYATECIKKIVKGEYALEYEQKACSEYIPIRKDGKPFDLARFEKYNFNKHFKLD